MMCIAFSVGPILWVVLAMMCVVFCIATMGCISYNVHCIFVSPLEGECVIG